MDFRELVEPTFFSLSRIYLNHVKEFSRNPANNASLSERVTACALRALAFLPLVVCAAIDLAIWSVMTISIIPVCKIGAKNYFINLGSTLSVFPQAIHFLAFGQPPASEDKFKNLANTQAPINTSLKPAEIPGKQAPINTPLELARIPGEQTPDQFRQISLFRQEFAGESVNWPELESLLQQKPFYLSTWIEKTPSSPEDLTIRQAIAEKLVELGAPLSTRDLEFSFRHQRRFSDLQTSVQKGFLSLTKKLLAKDDQLDPPLTSELLSARNNHLLFLAQFYKRPNLVKFMLEEGADPSDVVTSRDEYIRGRTAWSLAVENDDIESIQLFLQQGINPNIQNKNGYTAIEWQLLAISITKEHPTVLYHNAPDKFALDQKKRLDIIRMLIEAGCSLNAKFLMDEQLIQAVDHLTAIANNREIFSLTLQGMERNAHEIFQNTTALEEMQRKNQAQGKDSNSYLAEILNLSLRDKSIISFYAKSLHNVLSHRGEFFQTQKELHQKRTEYIYQHIATPENPQFIRPLAELVSSYLNFLPPSSMIDKEKSLITEEEESLA